MKIIKSYFQENKYWILGSMLVMGAGFGVGLIVSLLFPFVLTYLLDFLQQNLEKEIETLQSGDNLKASWLIFLRNLQATITMALSGLFFGIITSFSLFFNGFILGIVIGAMVSSGNILVVLTSLVPHGIVEIPTVILAGAWGYRLGIEWLLNQSKGKRGKVFITNLKKYFIALPFLVILLIFAAIIEVYVSGALATRFQ